MHKKKNYGGKCLAWMTMAAVLCQNFAGFGAAETIRAANSKIDIPAENIRAKNASGHGVEFAVDGEADTYWQSIPSQGEGGDYQYNRMYDHNRYIDIALDGLYHLSEIKIFNKTDGSYNNYYVYASADGVNYDKIISKTSNDAASSEGDSYPVDLEVSYLRLNMAYNSNSFATNLAEIEVYGSQISGAVEEPAEIQVENWEDSVWKTEWDKFENDKTYADSKVLKEMKNLVGRVLGESFSSSFQFELRDSMKDGKDIFEIEDGADGTIVIRGNSGLAMASGFNYYLKNYAGVDYNPMYGSNTALDAVVPVGKRVVKEAQFDLRYALNFCTYSYTMSFWNWDEYEAFLDWAAMNGINLILDIVGQEEVLRQTLREFNYTDEEIRDYICGPAYFAWFYMQNLYSIGGPLPNSWFEQRTELGRQIHDRMQTYGISPVIQAFAGQVPETFAEKNEGAVLTPVDGWSGFTRPSIIKTYLTESEVAAGKINYFSDAAEIFYEKQRNVFGNVSHYYAADPFHEGGNTGGLDVGNIYGEVQNEMLKSDPEAIWVMQQWQGNLNADKMSQLETEKTLPLDLQSDMRPQHGLFENNGAPWIYCMLHNFGGRMGLDGEIPKIASNPIETFNSTSNMTGIGMTPEAMENSPVVYELLFDTTWSKDPIDYRAWLKKYAKRRAGGESESLHQAWKILLNTAYANKQKYIQGAAETVINTRPADSFSSASTWGHSIIAYDKEELDQALLLLIENYEAFRKSPAYKYDLADVAEQTLCNAAIEYHTLMVKAKNDRNLEEFQKLSASFLEIIELSDQILATTDEFMLGTWIEAARKMITDADDWTKDLFEFNARSLVTTWGGERVGSLKDYSNRKWSGLTKSFYGERWAIWVRNRIAELKGTAKDPADAKAESNWFLWEYQWANRKSDDDDGRYAFETKPSDMDLAELAQQAYDSYSCTNLEKNTGGTAEETVNAAENKTVTTDSATKSGSLSNLTDGTTSTEWVAEGAGPHVLEMDLEGTFEVKNIVLSIQQLATDFPYTWKVEYLNSKTPEWKTLAEDPNGPVNGKAEISKSCTADKIRVTMTTADAVNAPLTITEITVNGIAEGSGGFVNVAKGIQPSASDKNGDALDGSLGNVTNGSVNDLWAPTGATWGNDSNSRYPVSVEVDFGQSLYVDSLDLHFEKAGLPFEFRIDITDGEGQQSTVFSECSSHGNVLEKKSYQTAVGQNVRKVTVVFLSQTGKGDAYLAWPAIAELLVMGTPPGATKEALLERISSIREILSGLSYGDSYGMYREEAKAAAEAVLSEAETAPEGDEQIIGEWLEKIEDALEEFYDTGMVYLNREAILTALSEAEDLSLLLEQYEFLDEKEELGRLSASARAVYDTYQTTQSEIDEAAGLLNEKIFEFNGIVEELLLQEEIQAAKEELRKTLDGLESRNEADYTAESWKNYQETVLALTVFLNLSNPSREDLEAAKAANDRLPQVIAGLVKREPAPSPAPDPAPNPDPAPSNPVETPKPPAVGTVHKTSTVQYKVTASAGSKKTVRFEKPLKKNAKKIAIPSSVMIDGCEYKVTEIKDKAFRKNTKITQAVIGANVKKIGKEAFFGCSKLKKITIQSKTLTGIGKKAFAGLGKKASISVPKNKYAAYKKLFAKAKTPKSVKITKKK